MSKKIRIDLKDPDGVWDSVEAAGYDLNELPEDVEQTLDKFVEFNENVSIEIDLETKEARVITNNPG